MANLSRQLSALNLDRDLLLVEQRGTGGSQFGIGGCVFPILSNFVMRATTEGLDTTRCDGAVVVPLFELPH